MPVLLETPSQPDAPYLELRAVDFDAALELYFLETKEVTGWDAQWVTLGMAEIVQYERLMNGKVILYLSPVSPAELQVIKNIFGWFAIGLQF